MKYFYTVNDDQFDDYMFLESSETHMSFDNMNRMMVARCAQQYELDQNWENLTEAWFYLWDENKNLLGKYLVERDWEPVFHVYKPIRTGD